MTDPYKPLFGRAVLPWHRWFAWRPVNTVDRGWVWFRVVNRRRCQTHEHLGPVEVWFQHAVDV